VDGLLKMSSDTFEGHSMTFTGLPPGGWFGEGTALKREPYRYNVQALRKSIVAGLPVDTFHWLLDHSIGFNRFVMNQINERLGQFIAAREIDRMGNPDLRVARSLAALFHPVLYPGVGEVLRITQQELAFLVGLSRQRVNEALQALQEQGMIRVEYGGLRVLDLDGAALARVSPPRIAMTKPENEPRPGFQRAPRPAAAPVRPPASSRSGAPAADGTATSRLNKRMAELGMASRREADDWIARGWVRVNGQSAEMGMQVSTSDRIEINKQAQGQQANQVTILLNKPMGIVSGQAEDGHQPAITLVQPQNRWADDNARFFFHPRQLQSLVPAGRLDIDSIGLLVLTQDGRVARQLIGEDSVMEKEYLVRVTYQGLPGSESGRAGSSTRSTNTTRSPATCRRCFRQNAWRCCAMASRSITSRSSRPRSAGRTRNSCAWCCLRARSARSGACANSSASRSSASSGCASAR
jgi:CRP/FNR family cyclic AMP-dependent transcriptional regulator